jgi:2-isopropylmalate synthase
MADKKKDLTDWDLEAIVNDETQQAPEIFRLEHIQVSCGDHAHPTATVTIRTPSGEELTDAAIGTGPVDAIYRAINRVIDIPNQLIEFSVQSVTEGIDALGEVTIRIRHEDRFFSGHGANTDIIVASAQAYINALNRLYATIQQGKTPIHPQHGEAQPVG